MLNLKKYCQFGLIVFLLPMILSSCFSSGEKARITSDNKKDQKKQVAMVADTAGLKDDSFNQAAWEGLEELKKEGKIEAIAQESPTPNDYISNFDKLADKKVPLVFGVGFALESAIITSAKNNKETNYVLIDNITEEHLDNLTSYYFRVQEPSFIAGYIAAYTTKTNKIGFIGGKRGNVIDQFEYGFRAGVEFAAREMNKKITIEVQYADSFEDAAKGKMIANKMFANACDIIFHAAAKVGTGMIEAAKESGKFAIGVDRDQSYLAPDNVLTSVLKRVGKVIKMSTEDFLQGKKIGGKGIDCGLKEDCVGIPGNNKNIDPEVYKKAMKIKEKIMKDEIKPPFNEETFNNFKY